HGPEDVFHSGARLELPAREVGRSYRETEIVLQPGRLLAVALPGMAVALPALGALPDVLAVVDELCRGRWRGSDHKGRYGRLLDKIRIRLGRVGVVDRELVLDVRDDGNPIIERQLVPRRHRRAAYPSGNGPQQIAVGRHRLLGDPEFEDAEVEIARALVEEEGRGGPIAIALDPVAANAAGLIDFLAVGDHFRRARKARLRELELLRLRKGAPPFPGYSPPFSPRDGGGGVVRFGGRVRPG